MRANVSVSTDADTRQAVRQVVDQCLAALPSNEPPFAALAFSGIDHDPRLVARSLHQALPGVPTIGCTTDGEISDRGLSVDSVCLAILTSHRLRARAAAIPTLAHNSFRAGAHLAEQLRSPQARVLILLPDGLSGNGAAIIRGAQQVLGSTAVIAGGTAGDGGQFRQTWQHCDGVAFSGGLVGLMLESDSPLELGHGVASGWRPVGIAKRVTRAKGNVVYQIEDRPALDVYSAFLGSKASELPSIGIEYPFAMIDDHGQVHEQGLRGGEPYLLLRAPMQVDHNSGAIQFAAEIPVSAEVKMTRAKSDDIIEASREAASRACHGLSGDPDLVLFFSCMARKMVLGRKTHREVEVAQEVFGTHVPMIGFYTYGEIANCGQPTAICRFHNETATFLSIRE